MEEVLVLYSGGLDSRIVLVLLKEKGFKVKALHFKLPFACSKSKNTGEFLKSQKIESKFIDCTKGKLLEEYLDLIKKPKYGRGAGINPCMDCKIWMFKKAKQYADKWGIGKIATGEVLGQRPMSQTKKALSKIDKEIGFKMIRPLGELGIEGRVRQKQMNLASQFKIDYPTPAGGCLLCDKLLAKRFRFLIEKDLINSRTLSLAKIGRHFYINGWVVVGRRMEENDIIEKFKNSIKSGKGKPAVYFHDLKNRQKAEALQKVYEDKNYEKIKESEKWKI